MADSKTTEKLIDDLTIRFGKEIADKLVSYVDMVLDKNQYINLTAVRDRDEAMMKHLADSLAVYDLPEYQSSSRVIDIGTGAGFPGAILAIASPDKEFVLMDAKQKKLNVVDEFVDILGIKNITTLHARAEDQAKKEGYGNAFDFCTSRAVAGLDKLVGWCLPFVKSGGCFAAYKGLNYEDELSEAQKSLKQYKGIFNRAYYPGFTDETISRHVIVVISKQ